MDDYKKYIEQASLEIRRGTLVLSVLSLLDEKMYGYSLIQVLSKKGLVIDQSTLYPLLRRLEKQGFLISDWSVEESRPRKYYSLSKDGLIFRNDLHYEWSKNSQIIEKLLK